LFLFGNQQGHIPGYWQDDTNTMPVHNLTSNLVYSASGAFVDTVICDGRILMQGGHVEGEEEIIREARRVAARLVPKN